MGIRRYSYYDTSKERLTLALGQFDALHIGHVGLAEQCRQYGGKCAMFTFSTSPKGLLGGDRKQLFTFTERVMRMERLGVDVCISADVSREMLDMSGEEFLNGLLERFNIGAIVIGEDYRCGKNAAFCASDIVGLCKGRGIAVSVVDILKVGNRKVSSSYIKSLISQGEVEEANLLLSYPYSILGRVVEGRSAGKGVLGFPTANIDIPADKTALKEGVYMTRVRTEQGEYPSITNVGRHPTFNDNHYNVESFILDFDGNLYGENIETVFVKRLRDTVKFDNAEALKRQISNDIMRIRREL